MYTVCVLLGSFIFINKVILFLLTIKNCDKTFRKNIIKRLKNTTF